jgi:hypothetical protein
MLGGMSLTPPQLSLGQHRSSAIQLKLVVHYVAELLVCVIDANAVSGSQSQKLSQASDFFCGSHPPVVRKVRRLSRKYGQFPASVVGFRLTGLRQCG